jgi:cytochrome c553
MASFRTFGLLLLALALLAAAPAFAQNAANGESLYMSICRACHGFPPSGGPERAAGNPALIQSALNRVPAMAVFRSVLSDSDIRDIAQFLLDPTNPNPPPPPPPPPVIPTYDLTDLWWNPQEPGWGLNLIQHSPSNNVFGVLYTYEASRRPLWLVMAGGRWTTTLQFEGDLFRTSGPHYNQPFDPTRVQAVKVGTMTIDLNGRDSGTVTYFVDGLRVAKPIQRQPF